MRAKATSGGMPRAAVYAVLGGWVIGLMGRLPVSFEQPVKDLRLCVREVWDLYLSIYIYQGLWPVDSVVSNPLNKGAWAIVTGFPTLPWFTTF